MGGSFGLIIDSSGDDFWVFSTAWVSNRRHGFVDRWLGFADRWLGWWVWWLLLAPTSLMVCVCVCVWGFVDGSVGSVRWVFFFFLLL